MALLTLLQRGRPHRRGRHALRRHASRMLAVNFAKLGIETTFVDARRPGELRRGDPAQHARRLRRDARQSAAQRARHRRASPTIAHAPACRWSSTTRCPRRTCAARSSYGADIVVHSATKYLGGHGTTMGGVIVESGRFPWDNGKFPGMTEPSRGYHGVKLLRDLRRLRLHDEGAHGDDARSAPRSSPMSAWLLLQGIETLPLRMERHCAQRAGGRAVPRRAPARRAGSTIPGCPSTRTTRSSRGRYLPRRAPGARACSPSASRAAPRRA